ncbi:MAG TPA: family 1 glycosylhydrolase [Nitrososphaeraceae archaeon]|jgi:beta-glucosidase|nr:family 1 glycosylhydrolase [Nitrososphaeraceae archaeon]
MNGLTKTFLWGVSTSSYQVEGDIKNNDWDYFTRSQEISKRIATISKPSIFYKGGTQVDLQPACYAAKFWDIKYYKKDFDLARSLGLNTFRISIEWARIEPEKDHWDQGAIDHYKEMLVAMRESSLMPVVSLNHATLPLWVLTPPQQFLRRKIQNFMPRPIKDFPLADPLPSDPYWKSLRGWENEETIERFVRYVERIVLEFRELVDYWITIGEPVATIIGGGYISGLWPPGFFLEGKKARIVLHNLIEAHIQAYNKISSLDDIDADGDGLTSKVGFSHLMMEVIPAERRKIFGITMNDNIEAAKNFGYFVNDYFINAVIYGEEDLNYLETLQRGNKNSEKFIVHEDWKNKADFIGLDYYRRVYVYFNKIVSLTPAKFVGGVPINDLSVINKQPHNILNTLGWEIYPEGLYNVIMKIKNQWDGIPIFITENGIADKHDGYRAPFIVSHLQQLRKAIDDGASIIGYLYWSFMDNYEWLDNYRPEGKFGLFRIDFEQHGDDSDLIRQKTKGAEALELIIRESFLQNKEGVISDSAIAAAQNKYGIFTEDGSRVIYPWMTIR